jgi:glutamyl-tRNA synthetase
MSRILSMNEYYIKNIDESELYKNFVEYCEIYKEKINPEKEVKIKLSLSFLKNKAKTLEDIYNNAKYIISDEIIYKNDDLKLIDEKAKKIIKDFKDNLSKIDNLNRENLEPVVNILIKNYETNFKGVGQPLRVALTGSKFGPGLYDIVISLGKEEVIKRLESKILIQN